VCHVTGKEKEGGGGMTNNDKIVTWKRLTKFLGRTMITNNDNKNYQRKMITER
jgi:hypothetical protein